MNIEDVAHNTPRRNLHDGIDLATGFSRVRWSGRWRSRWACGAIRSTSCEVYWESGNWSFTKKVGLSKSTRSSNGKGRSAASMRSSISTAMCSNRHAEHHEACATSTKRIAEVLAALRSLLREARRPYWLPREQRGALAMATMDTSSSTARSRLFLDVGGGASKEKLTEASTHSLPTRMARASW